MLRSLIHFWRTHLAVVLGAAVTTAVLTGALVVGDSLRGSLRALTLDRLGEIDWAVVAERPFRSQLAAALDDEDNGIVALPALTLRASATASETGARASRLALWGVGADFFSFYPELDAVDLTARIGPFPSAAINRALADELGVVEGAELVLAFERPSDVPRETVVGRSDTEDTVGVLRVTVARVLADRGAGGFGLEPQQSRPLNVFVDFARLQRAVLGRGVDRANAILGSSGVSIEPRLAASLELDDLGLGVRTSEDTLTVESREFVLDRVREQAILEAARELGMAAQPVLTYLATSLATGDRSVPYSTISAVDPPASPELGAFRRTDGAAVAPLADDEILLNAWTAERLGSKVGDPVVLEYFELGARDELTTVKRTLRLAGVVAMEGLALDRYLTPEFPGIEGADDISAWDPPFPVDLDRIQAEDEQYWDDYGAAPKAFVSTTLGRELWRSRFGEATSVRLALPPSATPAEAADRLAAALRQRLDPAAVGMSVRPLREHGLRAARGATDFAGLFLGLSMFLIASAALLAGLLFRLGVERRAGEVGLLRATGFATRTVRRRFLGEGIILAVVGAALGVAGGAVYAWALLAALRNWWLPAIGEPVLYLHLRPATLALGALVSIPVVVLAIALALRRLGKLSIVGLLSGAVAGERPTGSRRPAWIATGALAAAGALTLAAVTRDARTAAALAFGVGALLLIAGIAAFARYAGRESSRENQLGRGRALALAARDSTRSRGRSLLSVALMASASFVIVVVAANRLHGPIDVTDRASGAGGFTLVAETDVPILGDLASEGERSAELLAGVEVVPFRLLPGEDVSCLNLYQPERPRLLGVPPEMIRRGGFTFQQAIDERDDPWTLLDEPLADGVIPAVGDANSVLWILHSGLGKELEIENERGEPIRLRFVGLLEKSLFQSEVLISERAFQQQFPGRTGYSYFLLSPPEAGAARAATALESELARAGFDAVSTAERLAAFQAVEDTYLTTFQTLGALGLLLGTLGMGIILLRNVLERRSELATMRAVGYRRRRLQILVLAENAFLLFVGLGIGAAAGAIATAPHLALSGQPVPWLPLAGTLVAVFAVGMLSSALAVRSVARMPLVASLRAK